MKIAGERMLDRFSASCLTSNPVRLDIVWYVQYLNRILIVLGGTGDCIEQSL